MDDRDLEARLSARLHQRFDRAEPPLALSRDISDARLHARPSSSRRSGLISLLAAAAVFAIAAVALGAWFSRTGDIGGVPTASPSPTVSPSPSPSPSPTPTPTPTPVPSPTPTPTPIGTGACVPDNLSAQVIRWEGAAGSRFGTIAMQNSSPTDCTVSGTPGVLLLESPEHVFLNSANLGAPATTTPTTPIFTLQGGRANTIYLVAQLSNYCGTAPTPPVEAGLDLPGQPGPAGRVIAKPATGVTIDMAPCNGAGAPTTLDVQQPWSTTAP
jgi:hypothetical protein